MVRQFWLLIRITIMIIKSIDLTDIGKVLKKRVPSFENWGF